MHEQKRHMIPDHYMRDLASRDFRTNLVGLINSKHKWSDEEAEKLLNSQEHKMDRTVLSGIVVKLATDKVLSLAHARPVIQSHRTYYPHESIDRNFVKEAQDVSRNFGLFIPSAANALTLEEPHASAHIQRVYDELGQIVQFVFDHNLGMILPPNSLGLVTTALNFSLNFHNKMMSDVYPFTENGKDPGISADEYFQRIRDAQAAFFLAGHTNSQQLDEVVTEGITQEKKQKSPLRRDVFTYSPRPILSRKTLAGLENAKGNNIMSSYTDIPLFGCPALLPDKFITQIGFGKAHGYYNALTAITSTVAQRIQKRLITSS